MVPLPGIGDTVHLLGTLITFKATARETDGTFSLVEVATGVGQETPPHLQRDDAESFYVLEGTYEITVAGQARQCGRGSFVHVPRGVVHGFRNAGDRTARMLILNVPGGIHERFYADAGEPVADPAGFTPSAPDVSKITDACRRYGIELQPRG
ncbi:MAG TPA: cupin domain-containing protein [Geminicoccus sp.]|jgi:quercetin dioxygenase-like cupin family protein|uniref:cupin domain-containing protein n=1 Tax=Geminicoccus sp. TaxID=2024832 RepID=UPI002E33E252|nr:cupin domain-containing protein [Geminicoccus sp.]HEX2526005.1 cupin domain-containing protein [Geminicoccus sp.]